MNSDQSAQMLIPRHGSRRPNQLALVSDHASLIELTEGLESETAARSVDTARTFQSSVAIDKERLSVIRISASGNPPRHVFRDAGHVAFEIRTSQPDRVAFHRFVGFARSAPASTRLALVLSHEHCVSAQWCKQIDAFLRNSGLAWPVYQVTLDSPLSVRLFYRCFVLGLGERQVSA